MKQVSNTGNVVELIDALDLALTKFVSFEPRLVNTLCQLDNELASVELTNLMLTLTTTLCIDV